MKENVERWLTGESKEEFDEFKKFMNNSQGAKDFAKRKIRLIQDLIHNYKAALQEHFLKRHVKTRGLIRWQAVSVFLQNFFWVFAGWPS